MKSESMRHNTIKIKKKNNYIFVFNFFNSESGGVRNKLQTIQIKFNERFEIEKKKRERNNNSLSHTYRYKL
jgi:hypothetical protein